MFSPDLASERDDGDRASTPPGEGAVVGGRESTSVSLVYQPPRFHVLVAAKSMQSRRSFMIRSRAISDSAWIMSASFRMMVTTRRLPAERQLTVTNCPLNDTL